MLIKKPGDIPSSEITPKPAYLSRRKFIAGAAAAGAALAGGFYLRNHMESEPVHAGGVKLSGIVKSPLSTSETPNSFKDITNYNNYYEFSTDKYEPNGLAKDFRTRPWTVAIDGLVKKPQKLDIDAIMKLAPLEERIYRHRCVEGWSMVIPWVGIPVERPDQAGGAAGQREVCRLPDRACAGPDAEPEAQRRAGLAVRGRPAPG